MQQLKAPDWGYFAAALGIIVVGFTSNQEALGLLLSILGLLLLIYTLVPTLRSLPVAQRLYRWRDQKDKDAKTEQLRRQAEPLLEPWDLFHSAAGSVVARFYKLRDIDDFRAEDWQSFKKVIELALSLSGKLQKDDRDRAHSLLRCFLEVEQDALDSCSVAAAELNNWLLQRNVQFLALREKAGLPNSTYR